MLVLVWVRMLRIRKFLWLNSIAIHRRHLFPTLFAMVVSHFKQRRLTNRHTSAVIRRPLDAGPTSSRLCGTANPATVSVYQPALCSQVATRAIQTYERHSLFARHYLCRCLQMQPLFSQKTGIILFIVLNQNCLYCLQNADTSA